MGKEIKKKGLSWEELKAIRDTLLDDRQMTWSQFYEKFSMTILDKLKEQELKERRKDLNK